VVLHYVNKLGNWSVCFCCATAICHVLNCYKFTTRSVSHSPCVDRSA